MEWRARYGVLVPAERRVAWLHYGDFTLFWVLCSTADTSRVQYDTLDIGRCVSQSARDRVSSRYHGSRQAPVRQKQAGSRQLGPPQWWCEHLLPPKVMRLAGWGSDISQCAVGCPKQSSSQFSRRSCRFSAATSGLASASGHSRAGHLNGIESQAARATSPLRLHFMICSPCPSHLASPYIPLPVSTSDPAPLSQDPRSQRTLLKTSFPIRPTARQLPANTIPRLGCLSQAIRTTHRQAVLRPRPMPAAGPDCGFRTASAPHGQGEAHGCCRCPACAGLQLRLTLSWVAGVSPATVEGGEVACDGAPHSPPAVSDKVPGGATVKSTPPMAVRPDGPRRFCHRSSPRRSLREQLSRYKSTSLALPRT